MKYSLKINDRESLFLIFIYFFSGIAALIYQVIWQRWLAFFTGISSVNISLIVSAFMTGLGLGYLIGGYLADRIKIGKHIYYFFAAEIGIGLFALFSKAIFYDWLFIQNSISGLSPLALYVTLFMLLLIPTFLMGVSLPILSKSIRSSKRQGNFISLLYFTNTLGAAFGTFITTFILIPRIGFEYSVYVAAFFNFFCGASVLLFFYFNKSLEQNKNETFANEVSTDNVPLNYWMVQYFISGFTALALEVIWFRLIDVMMKSYAVTFSIILTIYLGSMALGSWLGVIYNNHSKSNLLKVFLRLQMVLYFYVALTLVILFRSVDSLSFLEPLRVYFEGYDEVSGFKIKILTMILIPVFLMSVPTFIMGFSFSVSQNIIQNDYNSVGRKLGWLQFINIAGSTAGAWFASLIGFEVLGTAITLKILTFVAIIYIAFSWYKKYLSTLVAFLFTGILIGLVILIPGKNDFWRIASGVKNQETFVFSEDKTALSSIKIASPHSTVFVNGLGQSHFPMKDDYFHIMLGAVPTFLHPNPELVGIIGLGSAGTLYGASGREETKSMICWEVIKSQPDVLYEFVKRTADSSAYHILKDKRLDLRLVDGRRDLQSSEIKFDILEADALRPRSSYSGNLYSVEYFSLLKSKLKSDGIAVTWAPTERIKNSFRMVFPFVYQIQESLFIGSENAISFDKEVILKRFDNKFSKEFFDRAEIDAKAIMNNFINTLQIIQEGRVINSKNINTDMWPKDEYQLR